jgi:ATP-dependent DNA ligase
MGITTISPFILAPHPKTSLVPSVAQYKTYIETLGWIAQPKINGNRIQVCIYPDGKMLFFTRQGTIHTKPIDQQLKDKLLLHYKPNSDLTVIEGEWLPYGQQKIYLFDILKCEGQDLSGLTYLERYHLLCEAGSFIYPDFRILPIIRTVDKCVEVMEDNNIEIEGLVFKSPYPYFRDSNIVRCRKVKK